MAFKMKGTTFYGKSPFKDGDGWWAKIKRQFSGSNPHGFGDSRGRRKKLTTSQIKNRISNPRKRGESMAAYRKRIKE